MFETVCHSAAQSFYYLFVSFFQRGKVSTNVVLADMNSLNRNEALSGTLLVLVRLSAGLMHEVEQ